jgi:hypothetical protein
MIVSCEATPCPVILSATCVFYKGENLIYTGINMNDNLQTALEKIDGKFQDAGIGYIFENGIIQLNPGEPVRLGGSLMQNTTINSAGFTFTLSGTFEASALITTGGTANDFVKGDGSLDSTSYQPAGSYITALTGDGTASGPGSVPLTLATVNANPGTYGSALAVPVVTVNAKGLVTNITPVSISLPAGTIILVGDVSAVGTTGAPITATLATVNSNIYGTNTFLKFAVNAKGLVTSAAPVTLGDLTSVLGFMPVPDSRTLTINGLTRDLTADRTWSVGTVTSVQVAVPPAFSVTTAPITSFGTINIAATGNTSQYIRGDGSLAAFPAIPTTSGTSGSSGSSGISSVDTNIYNSDGTLTGNRIITLDSKQLVYRDSSANLTNYTYSVGVPTGVPSSSWPSSVIYEGQYLISSTSSAEPFNTRLWGRNQSASIKQLWVNQVYADITGESTGAPYIYNQTFNTRRGSQLDTSTASGWMEGLRNIIGHVYAGAQSTTTQINTSSLVAYRNSVLNYVGNITNVYGVLNDLLQSTAASTQNSTITNYYGFYTSANVGTASGPTASISNYYGLYLNTPTVGATGTITNRWGVYAPDTAMSHYFAGKVGINTSSIGSNSLLSVGLSRFENTVTYTTGAATQPNTSVIDITFAASASISTGSHIGASISYSTSTFNGNITIPNSTIQSSQLLVQRVKFNSAAMVITMTQGGTGVRALGPQIQQLAFDEASTTGTLTHAAGIQILAPYKATNNIATITNWYGAIINPSDEYSTKVTITNRWGVYQQGTSDNNWFAGKVIIGSTNTVGGSNLNVKNLPTSSAGLIAGDVWNDGGTLKIV